MMQSAPFNYRRLIIWLGRLILGGIFIYAGFSKIFYPNYALLWPPALWKWKLTVLMNLSNFGNQVDSYKMLPDAGVWFVSHTLPFAEVALGLLVVIGWRLRVWVSLVSLLLLGFFGLVTRAYLLGLKIDCGCFGKPEPLTGWTVIRDGSMLTFALLVTYFAFQEARQPHPWSSPQVPPPATT